MLDATRGQHARQLVDAEPLGDARNVEGDLGILADPATDVILLEADMGGGPLECF